ncbi:MAG: SRPBCC family protein [Pseudohongiella sp.]|nr:SRPBCC family protein [Pseudohongiella sp.]
MNSHDQIVKTVDIKAPVARVWQALTDYQQFGEWFRVKLNEPFSPGSRSTGVTTYPGYEGHQWFATIETMEHESLFSFRWNHDNIEAGLPPEQQPTTHVEFKLEKTGTGTRLTITESGFAALPESKRGAIMRGNTEGWNIQSQNISDYVTGE